jgi:hypothetical protein
MSKYVDVGFVLNRLCMTLDLIEEKRALISPQDLDEMEIHLNSLLTLISTIRKEADGVQQSTQ